MELSVANATAAFEMVLSPGAGIASAAGKKETKGFLMQGASPLAFPGLGGARHGLNLRSKHPTGAYPPALVARPAIAVPDGGLPCWSPANPAFSLLFCPHPPNPLPLRGRGRPRLFHARGFAPCIPGAGWGAARVEPAEQASGGGAYPPALAARPAVAVPGGGFPGGVTAYPPSACFFAPIPPNPLPGGKGETKVISCKGLRPLHPRDWVGRGTG